MLNAFRGKNQEKPLIIKAEVRYSAYIITLISFTHKLNKDAQKWADKIMKMDLYKNTESKNKNDMKVIAKNKKGELSQKNIVYDETSTNSGGNKNLIWNNP